MVRTSERIGRVPIRIEELRPGRAYLDRWLYLPKEKVLLSAVKAALTMEVPPNPHDPTDAHIVAYKELPHHVMVPRAFVSKSWLDKFSIPVDDHRPREYQQVGFASTFTPRDFEQEKAATALIEAEEGGILELGCGRGKTPIALHVIAQLGQPSLIVVNNTTHIDQWIGEAEKFLGRTPTIVQGSKREFSELTVAMLHTLSLREWDDKLLSTYGSVFFDETHHLGAPTFNKVCPLFAGKRFGLTATVRREDGLEDLYLYHLGPVLFTDMRTDLKPEVIFIKTGERFSTAELDELKDVNDLLSIPKVRRALTKRESRNKLILEEIRAAREKGRRILVLGHIVEHLRWLQSECPGSGLCTGVVPPKTRHRVLKECDVIFGTTSLAAEGLNAPWLDTLFLITPFKAQGLFQQAVGRVLRQYSGKKKPMVIVFQDEFKPIRAMTASFKKYLKTRGIEFDVINP